MKVSWSDLTPEEQATFGNGCSWVPDFIFTASCRQHDLNFVRGSYERLVWESKLPSWVPQFVKRLINGIEIVYRGIKAKVKADYDLCIRIFDDAFAHRLWFLYMWVGVFYFLGLTLLPFSYFFFTWGRYRTKTEILAYDKLSKI